MPGLAKVVFATYNNLDPWLYDEPDTLPELKVVHGSPIQSDQPGDSEEDNEIPKGSFVNSRIISASVNGRKGEQVPLKEPVFYTLEHLSVCFSI